MNLCTLVSLNPSSVVVKLFQHLLSTTVHIHEETGTSKLRRTQNKLHRSKLNLRLSSNPSPKLQIWDLKLSSNPSPILQIWDRWCHQLVSREVIWTQENQDKDANLAYPQMTRWYKDELDRSMSDDSVT